MDMPARNNDNNSNNMNNIKYDYIRDQHENGDLLDGLPAPKNNDNNDHNTCNEVHNVKSKVIKHVYLLDGHACAPWRSYHHEPFNTTSSICLHYKMFYQNQKVICLHYKALCPQYKTLF